MECQSYQCPNCPASIPEQYINFKERTAKCPYCNSFVQLPRKTLNSSDAVIQDMAQAVRFFCEGNYDSARNHAERTLSVSFDNAVALFVIAYYNAYCAPVKTFKGLDIFFKETLQSIELEAEEADGFKKVVLCKGLQLGDYEKYILKALSNSTAAQPINTFIDEFSAPLIVRRKTIDWFDEEMCMVYAFMSQYVEIPKTWYALYQGIVKNPDSPEAANTYYLKTKTERFFNSYVLGVGKVFESIQSEAMRAKFLPAYQKIRDAMKAKMQ